jgi:uncharacterized protein (TIGR02118 family)
MSALRKVVVAVHGPIGDAVPDVGGLQAYSVHRPHPDEPPVHPDDVTAVVMAWLDGDAALAPASWFDTRVTAYLVDERVQIDWNRDWPDGTATPGVEQISFVRRLPELTREEFAAHWSDRHTPLVPVHHPGVARYIQNVVVDSLTDGAPDVDGIAQLYFRTARDLHERFYDSEEGKRIVGEDVARFIDRPRGWRITAQETWWRS